jgi:3-oxoadipate enol-lactonase
MQGLSRQGTVIHFRADLSLPNAPTLVFINSLGTDFRIWDGVIQHLKGTFNVVVHDKRGHGLSGLGDEAISIKTYASDVEALLLSLDVRNIVLCGLSVGGLIAQELLSLKTLALKGVVLSNAGLKIGNDESWNTRLKGIADLGLEGIAQGVMERWFSADYLTTNPEHLALFRTMLSRTPEAGYVACCKAIRDHAGFDHSGRNIPALCIGGSVDGSTPPALVKAMAANINGPYLEFENAGHLPCIEQPARYAAAIAEFARAL